MANYNRYIILLAMILYIAMPSSAQIGIIRHVVTSGRVIDLSAPQELDDSIVIEGRVVESLAKRDLLNAFMIPIDSTGNPCDTIKSYPKISFAGYDRRRELSYVRFKTSRRDSTYVFEIGCPGYTSQTVVYKVERVGKREMTREMPLTILERAPHKLGEVQVVASKVKFYHRGDTLVYNADAFQLAEGSMLDELIRQLPGVELNNDGQIKVNGEVVETLLLNGKHFFSNDRKLMLDNLGAYTVKNVEVYRGQTAVEKWVNDPNAKKHLTMDVKLKKEYSMGYLLNLQAGYGTHDRYLGRLFASWFSPTANVSLVGNINNVNDRFSPRGVNDSWSSSGGFGSGDSRYNNLGLNYDIESNDWKRTLHGYVTYNGSREFGINNVSSASFYANNQVYNYSFSKSLSRNFHINTSHDVMFDLGRLNLSGQISGSYRNSDRNSSSLSASFNKEQADITQEALETIYGNGSASALVALINRTRTLTKTDNKSGDASLSTTTIYKIPGTSDVVQLSLSGSYNSSKSDDWNDYRIDYSDKDKAPDVRRQYTDGSPNHTLSLDGTFTYTARIGKVSLDIEYASKYLNNKSDTYLYALQNLADMGEFGTLPADYLSAFDPADSYMSKRREISNSLAPHLRYEKKFEDDSRISIYAFPRISITNRKMDYWRDNHLYNIRHNSRLGESLSADCEISFYRPVVWENGSSSKSISYRYSLQSQLPSMMSLVDIVDDTNPLFIRQGNPYLKSSRHHRHSINWRTGRNVSNNLDISYSYSTNDVTQASVYDMNTGVTRSRAENISGNNTISIYDMIYYSFGRSGQFSLITNTGCDRMHNVDLMSTDGSAPVKTSADTWSIRQDIDLRWRFGRNYLSASCDAMNQRTYSDRADFNKINAFHVNYGINGIFHIPGGFEVGTSFSLYTRRGYGSKELDTTDAIWNANASYAPKGKRWVFTLNAYDLLRQVSNIHYMVSATGRTVIYNNSLPSYIIATVQYRLNIQPKKRND